MDNNRPSRRERPRPSPSDPPFRVHPGTVLAGVILVSLLLCVYFLREPVQSPFRRRPAGVSGCVALWERPGVKATVAWVSDAGSVGLISAPAAEGVRLLTVGPDGKDILEGYAPKGRLLMSRAGGAMAAIDGDKGTGLIWTPGGLSPLTAPVGAAAVDKLYCAGDHYLVLRVTPAGPNQTIGAALSAFDARGRLLYQYLLEEGTATAFAATGERYAAIAFSVPRSGTLESLIWLLDMVEGRLWEVAVGPDAVTRLELTPEAEYIAAAAGKRVILLNRLGQRLWSEEVKGTIAGLAIAELNSVVLLTADPAKVTYYDPRGRRLWERVLDGSPVALHAVANGSGLVMATTSSIHGYDVKGRLRWTAPASIDLKSLAVSPSGSYVLCVYGDGGLRLIKPGVVGD